MNERQLETVLTQYTADLKGLRIAYIGDRGSGNLLALHNPRNLNENAVAMHTAEVLRALTRLHSVMTGGYTESNYFVSNSPGERIMVQGIGKSSWYLAFITSNKADFQDTVKRFKQLLRACQPESEKVVS